MFTFRIFTFIVNLLEEITDLAENDFLKNNLVSHLISLSTELGPECKAALCKLGEVVLPRLIHLIYEQQKTGSTLAVISQLYKALLSQFNTHHPLGIDCKESFFVGDAEKWNSILKRVYYMIESEISHLQRSKETECNSDFIHLAVHLIGWFYNKSEEVSMCDVTIDLDTSVRAKRMKLTVLRIEYFIQVLEQSNSAYDIWPVLHIVACLVFRFPKLITSEEYKVLLQLFAAYQSNNFTNNEKIMDYLYEAFFSFLFALEHVTFPDDQVNQIWKNIFQNTNKIIGLNQCVRSSHLLLRYLLNLKYDLCHTDLLMQSYTDKVVSLNEESLKTLFFLISKVQINTETRLKLMDWIFQRTTTKITSLHLYTATATMFILCSNVRPLQLETSKSELDHFFAFLQPSSLEYFYTTNNFDQGIFTGKSKVITSWCSSYELDKFIDEKQIIFNESILKNMYEYWSRLVIIMSQKMTNDVLDVNSIDFILNNLSLWIYFSKYNHYLPPQCMLKQSLITSLPDLLSNVLQKLSRLNVLSAETHSTLFNLFHSINESQICLLSSVGTNIIGTYLAAVEVNQLPSGNFLETVMPLSTYPKSEYVDESVNRTASFLHAIASIISSCPCVSRKMLFYSCVMFVKKKFNVNLLRKLVFLILKHMNINVKQLMTENMFYILTAWYDSFETLLTFPYHILSLDINTFLNANLIHIVTVLYINKNGNEIGHYAKLLSKDVSSLVLVALPKILALGSRDMIVSSEQFESCDLVRNKLEDVLLELLCNVSDYKHLNMKACVPQPCASNITFIQLKSRLEFLTIKLDLNVSPIQYLCQNKPSSIQKIHLHLSRAIYEARSSEFRIEAIHRYEMFLQLLEPILNQSNDLILDFLIHSVIYTLLHTLGSSNEAVDCANIVLNCMNRFLHATLPQCSSIISTLLPCLVGSLVPITHAQLKKECLCIIEFLVVDHCKELREGILALDPFPHSEDYKVISQVYNNFRGYLPRTCLSKEIGHFVASTYSNPHCKITQQCRLEGLNNIDHLLTHERKDLNIINSSQLSNFELDKLEKMMNRLIFILSELARSPDSEISNKALVCLGKIGPYSMNSTALASHESQMNTAHTSNGDLMLTQVITAKLILYLSSSNVKVVSIASECLFNLLDTPEGRSIVDKLSSAQRKFIYPMLPTHNKCLVKASLEDLFDERKFKELIDVTGLWVPNTATTYERWISHLTANMIICFETSKCYLKYLIELCSIKTDFAEEILRYLIYFIIRIPSETREAENILTTRIGYFFSCHHNAVSSRNSTDGEIHMNKKAIKCLLDVIHFVRINQDSPDKTLLRVNYLHVAQAALYCSAPFSAIFYSHISSEQLCSELELEYRDQSLSTLDYICNYRSTEGPNLQDILRRAYTEINDLDAVQGCGNAHLRELSSRIVHYQNANNWQRVLQCSDILMSTSGQSEQMKMSLAKCGLYFIQTRISESQDLEASWRLSQWDYADDLSEEPTFDLYHYRALKCLHQGETIQCMDNINAARKSLVNFLCLTDMECTKQVQLVLSKLRMLQEIQEFTEVDSNDIIIHKWEENQFIGDVDFKLIEPILYQRCILLDESCDESMAIVPYYLKIAQRARIANHFHIAERILTTVDGKSLSKFDKFQVLFELSQLLWDRNEIEAARASLRIILPKMHDESKCKLIYSQALRTYGCWQASTKSENLSSIIRKYLQPALEILLCDQLHERLKAYNCLATYADEKQLQISDILISVSKMQRPDVPYGSKIEMKQQAIDARETETHKLERKTYLHMSMKYYIKSLAEGNLNDIKAFRVVSLWLDNIDDTDLLNMLAKSIITVPSYKFVKVLPQLVARISNVQNKPNALILQVIEKCAVDHPHHTLPLIMAVANSLKDEIYIKKSSELPVKSSTMESRIKGADYVIMKLKKLESPFCKNLVEITRQQEALSYAYIIFANYVLGDARYSASKHTIPSSQQLIKIKDFDQICVSTMNLKLNIDGIYDSIVGIHKFDRTYCIPGGVNEPKKITCIGTDGHRYIQLLKGKDDPRQDAVMQQVFTIMNDLLKSKRNLSVMTYKVVPLSQMSGIIEWCTNSLPVCLYLLGDNTTLGAHAKYNPQDITHRKCRECLEKLHKASAPTSKKLNEYLNICKKFKPVFRYFFLEQFQNPNEWYNMQTNYTRSVATSSMIGYILGLGDRHLNNILINLKTAQVIHIDFGIAFEQGLILPTPETVPFRLTRDVEDGMGVTGTEGTFKKTCETTLSVLRENSETLLTILEVLLYDPLYTWTLTPSKAAERQKVTNSKNVNTETNVPVNKIAARALFRLKQKLQGIEEGNVFSVEGQVSILIQRAKDPENLCRLFPGWQPYL
ncbi:hypothetical protein M8J77_018796 [Diaphorina citri]|nr:hypothetical protein M8J77_018796 [Diaphorina citri]